MSASAYLFEILGGSCSTTKILYLTIEEAMRRAKYNQKAAQYKRRQKNVSKMENRILAASGRENIPSLVQISQGSRMETSTATQTLNESNRSNATASSKKGAVQKTVLEKVPPLRMKVLASSSRRTKNQVLKAHKGRNHAEEVRNCT